MADETKRTVVSEEPVTRNGGMLVEDVEKTPADRLKEEFGSDWPIQLVRFGHDDGGTVLEVHVDDEQAGDFRLTCPTRYEGYNTIVMAVPVGYWKED